MLEFTPGVIMVLGLLIVSTACRGRAQSANEHTWQTASPGDVGLDPAPFERLREDAGTLQYTASVSKSVGSILLEVAMEQELIASSEGQPTIELVPTDSTKFVGSVLDLFDATFEFETGVEGRIEGMTATWGFTTSEGRKVGS